MTTPIDVVVIGGGYAGVMAANRLTRRDDVAVTLVNPRPVFVDRIRLHQLVAGTGEAARPFGTLLNARVRLLVDAVDGIDTAARTLRLASGAEARYDRLVYAVGSGSADPAVPGAAEFAFALADLEQAQHLRSRLQAEPAASVTVVGAGPTGIEAAAELAEAGRSVTLIGGVLGPYLHPRGRRAVADRLAALGVTVLDGPGSIVTAVDRDTVTLRDGRTIASGVTVWTAGFGVPDLARRSGLRTDAAGRLLTDETLTSLDDERIVATGDAAAPSGLPYRMSCQAAMQVGPQAAETVLSRLAGRPPAPVGVGFAGQCISLGRAAGVFQFASPGDRPRPWRLRGRVGARVKETICRAILWQLRFEARRPGLVRWWMTDRSRSARLAAAPVDRVAAR